MPISSDSPIFSDTRKPAIGLTDAQLADIVDCINRSVIFERRIRDFERAGGAVRFDKQDRNYFWEEEGVPVVYVSPQHGNVDGGIANVQVIAQVLAHEMAHFETYFFATRKINPNNQRDENCAGALGVRDEARAYALEVLVQREIKAAGGTADWLRPEQAEAADRALSDVAAEAGEIDKLDAATLALLDWAANLTNDPDTGGYYEFYQNAWLKENDPNRTLVARDVTFRCNARGDIVEVEFTDAQEGRRIANVDPPVGRLGP
jgi:hypothetical protein